MLRDGSVSCKTAGWMPILLAAFLAIGMIVSYVWSQVRKDVEDVLPFISAAGGNPPQSGIFAIFLYLSATVGLMTMIVRFAVLHQETYKLGRSRLAMLNNASLVLGLASLFGMLMVAAYPVQSWKKLDVNETTTKEDNESWSHTVLLPHTIGAVVCFSVGLVYGLLQSLLSFYIRPALCPGFWAEKRIHILIFRVCACILAFAALLVMFLVRGGDGGDMWKATAQARVRAGAEWILALMLGLLFLSLYPEMKSVKLEISARAPPCDGAVTRYSTDEIVADT